MPSGSRLTPASKRVCRNGGHCGHCAVPGPHALRSPHAFCVLGTHVKNTRGSVSAGPCWGALDTGWALSFQKSWRLSPKAQRMSHPQEDSLDTKAQSQGQVHSAKRHQ